jgi:hypothetical protein
MAEPETAVIDTPPADDWRTSLPEDLRADKTLATIKDIPSLAKMLVESQKLIGSSIRLPNKDAKPDELTKWKTDVLGKLRTVPGFDTYPESPDKYQITRPEIAASGWNAEAETAFLTEMHKVGATGPVVQAALNFYGKLEAERLGAAQREAQAVEAALRQEWGPNYAAHLGRANRAISEFGGEGLVDLFRENGMGRHPVVVKAFAAIGNALVEHGAIAPDGNQGMSADEAQEKLRTIRSDKTHPFNDPNSPHHSAALDEVLALTRIARQAA